MRWMLRLAGGLGILGLIGLAVLAFIPGEKVAAILGEEVLAATGQRLEIGGDVRPVLWPEPGVRIGEVRLVPAEGGGAPLLEARALNVGIAPRAIWGGEIRVTRVEIVAPVIRLHRDAAGRANWAAPGAAADRDAGDGDGDGAVPAAAVPGRIALDAGRVTGGRIEFSDESRGTAWLAEAVDLRLAAPGGGPARLSLEAVLDGAPLTLEATVDDLAAALSGGVSPVAAEAAAGHATARFAGRAGFRPAMAEGRLEATAPGIGALLAALGIDGPQPPPGLGRDSAALTGELTLTREGTVHLREGSLTLDGNRVTGAADLTPGGARPKLAARLSAGELAFPALAPGGAGAGRDEARAAGWPDDPIATGWLGLFDGQVRLTADSLTFGGTRLSPLDATVTAERSRMVFDIARAGAFGGTLTGSFVANGRGGFSARTDLRARGVDLRAFLSAFLGYDRLTGSGDVAFRALGVGDSVAALARSLEGEGSLRLAGGELKGVDLSAMLRFLDPARVGEETATRYDHLTASWTIAEGVMRTADLTLEAPLVTATGAGSADIGARTLDMRIKPVALAGPEGQGGTRVPLRITGPWAAPRFTLDMEAVARDALAERLEEVQADIAADLGIEPAEGESLEDAAKRRLEEIALEELERALGGE